MGSLVERALHATNRGMADQWLAHVGPPEPYRPPFPPPLPMHTARCVVRCYQSGDAPQLFAAVQAKRQALLPWLPWASTDHQTIDESIYYVERVVRAHRQPGNLDFHFGIFDKRSGEQLGGTGLHQIDVRLHEAEVGYWIRGDRHGEGLCSEAVAGLLKQAFAPRDEDGFGLRRLTLFSSEENAGSIRVAEKVGFRREGLHRQATYLGAALFPETESATLPASLKPGFVDKLSFALLREEFEARV